MINLNRHKLTFEIAFAYFDYTLTDTNIVLSTLMKFVNFKSGKFFTLLPDNANLEKINEFRYGGMAGGVRDHIATIILNKLHSNDKLSCIFADATATFSPEHKDPLFQFYVLIYAKEIYYLITRKTASIQHINQCLRASNAIWHSLCVLTTANFSDLTDKELSLNKIKEICLNSELIIVGAYDGEGYVFWEKS